MSHSIKAYKVTPVDASKGFRIHMIVFLLVIPALWLVWSLTDRSYPWPLWSTASWVTGIVFHYLGIYVFKKKAGIRM